MAMLKRKFLLGGLTALLGAIVTGGSSMAQANGPVDLEALAALRPGMPVARVVEAMGSSWRAPAPHRGGVVDILENSHGIVVRLDRDDVIGGVEYDWRFKDAAVDGLRMGMSLADAKAAMPELEVGGDLPMMPGVREGRRVLPGGGRIDVKFTLETVNGIEFTASGAVFRESTMPPYAAPSGEAGAPFGDTNFKLVVLSSLLEAKVLDFGTPENLATHVLGRPVDLEQEGYDPMPEVLDYLARYPVTDELLASVRSIVFDGGNEIYRFPWYFWSGEDDLFEIADIGGIALCPNVTSVEAISMIDRLDIGELASLAHLDSLSISTGFENLDALRRLAGLKRLRLLDDDAYAQATTPGHPTRDLLDSLKARGVSVRVSPMTWSGEDKPRAFE